MKRVGLIKMLRTNSAFLVALLLLGRKTKKKSLKLFKIYHWNGKEWKLEHTKSQMKPCWSGLHQCVAATFQSVGLFFWRKLMNLLRPSITTIFQHRTDGCSNGCSFLACTILYIVKKHPLLTFFKIWPKQPELL